MINIKSLKTVSPGAPTPDDIYRASQVDAAPSRLPAVLAVALATVALYLRSIFPETAKAAAQTPPVPPADEDARAPTLDQAINPKRDDDLGTQARKAPEADPDATIGGAGPEAAALVLVQDDRASRSASREVPQSSMLPSPGASAVGSARPANDNGAGASSVAGASDSEPRSQTRAGTPEDDADKNTDKNSDKTTNDSDDADLPNDRPNSRNRAPLINGPVFLPDISACHMTFIAALSLLAGATDEDGDTLTVRDLVASSGALTITDGGWLYDPSEGDFGAVTFSYVISDGTNVVSQTASLTVTEFTEITGTADDDILLGSMCADVIDGKAGHDLIDARSGNDVIRGGSGNDHIVAGAGNDTIDAGIGDDIVFGGPGHDVIAGGEGNDILYGDDGDDLISGDAGDDQIVGGIGNDQLFGGAGNDVIAGGDGHDLISGGDGDDRINAGNGDNLVLTGEGDNHVVTEDGANTVIAGSGADQIRTGAGNDVVTAGGGNDVVHAGAGADLLLGEGGHDTILGEAGDDTILGGDGNDLLNAGEGQNDVYGEAGNDLILVTLDVRRDRYDGGEGDDTLDLSRATTGLQIDLIAGQVTGTEIGSDSIVDLENIIGGSGSDHFIVGTLAKTLTGGEGEDIFTFRVGDSDDDRDLIHKILDLEPGDRIVIRQYQISELGDNDEQSLFQDAYSNDEDDLGRPFRFRIEGIGEDARTYVDVDFEDSEDNDDDEDDAFMIEITGVHQLHYW